MNNLEILAEIIKNKGNVSLISEFKSLEFTKQEKANNMKKHQSKFKRKK